MFIWYRLDDDSEAHNLQLKKGVLVATFTKRITDERRISAEDANNLRVYAADSDLATDQPLGPRDKVPQTTSGEHPLIVQTRPMQGTFSGSSRSMLRSVARYNNQRRNDQLRATMTNNPWRILCLPSSSIILILQDGCYFVLHFDANRICSFLVGDRTASGCSPFDSLLQIRRDQQICCMLENRQTNVSVGIQQ